MTSIIDDKYKHINWIYCYQHDIDIYRKAFTFISDKGEILHLSSENESTFLEQEKKDKHCDIQFENIMNFNSYFDDITYICYNEEQEELFNSLERLQKLIK
jgi:hypothetical protein